MKSKYKSRKNRKRALGLGKIGSDANIRDDRPASALVQSLIGQLTSAFGTSKHRKARQQRFKSRQGGKS